MIGAGVFDAQARQGRHQQLQFADAMLFGQNFGQGLLRPTTPGQVAIELFITAGQPGRRACLISIATAPDTRVLEQLVQRWRIAPHASLRKRLIQRHAVTNDANHNTLDDKPLFGKIDLYWLELLVFR